MEEVGGLEGAVRDWRPNLVNKSAENNSLDFKTYNKLALDRSVATILLKNCHISPVLQ